MSDHSLHDRVPVASFFAHLERVAEKVGLLAVAPAQFQAVVPELGALEPRRLRRQRTRAEFRRAGKRADADRVGGLHADSKYERKRYFNPGKTRRLPYYL